MPLQRWVDPSRVAFVIIDVQNEYCHENGWVGRKAQDKQALRAILDPIKRVAAASRLRSIPVIYIRTEYNPSDTSDTWRNRAPWAAEARSCRAGSWGAEFYELQPETDGIVITKHRYSAFVGTPLELVLRSLGRQAVLLAGVATNVCVETTARDALMRDFDVAVLRDGCAAITADFHEASLRSLEHYFGRVLDTEQVLAAWL